MSTDPIYRDSAMALEGMCAVEVVAWMATLLEIRMLPETEERS